MSPSGSQNKDQPEDKVIADTGRSHEPTTTTTSNTTRATYWTSSPLPTPTTSTRSSSTPTHSSSSHAHDFGYPTPSAPAAMPSLMPRIQGDWSGWISDSQHEAQMDAIIAAARQRRENEKSRQVRVLLCGSLLLAAAAAMATDPRVQAALNLVDIYMEVDRMSLRSHYSR